MRYRSLFLIVLLAGPTHAQFDTSATAAALAQAMGIPAAYIVSASLFSIGTNAVDPRGAAVHTGTLGNFSPREGTTFAVITSGDVAIIPGSNDEAGADVDQGTESGSGVESGGDDLVKLVLVLNPPDNAKAFSFDFAFLSEEYPEFVGTAFNDFFVVEKDGSQITFDTSSGNTKINSPYNICYDQQGQPISINANFFKENTNQNTGTEMDGWTPVLTTCAPLISTDSLVLTFFIGDIGDAAYQSVTYLDNFLFLEENSFTVTYNPATNVILGQTTAEKPKVKSYPNPFIPTSGGSVTFALEGQVECCIPGSQNGITEVQVLDISGRRIINLFGISDATIKWNGRNSRGDIIGSGIYYYVVKTADGRVGTGRFTVVK